MARQEAGNYKNSGSDHNRGLTWTYVPRTTYAGVEVNWSNKKEVLEQGMREYKRKNTDASVFDCWVKGKEFVNRQRKHEKAYRKGLSFYKYKGGIYPVEDKSRMEVFVEAARAFNEKVEQKINQSQIEEALSEKSNQQ